MLIWIIRFILILLGAVGGYQLGPTFPLDLPDDLSIIGIIVYVILGIGLGYVLGGIIGRYVLVTFNKIEESIAKSSWSDILIAVAGLTIGLLVAFLVSYPFRYIDEPPLLRTFLIIVSFAALGYLGVRLSMRKKDEIRRSAQHLGQGRSGAITAGATKEKLLDTSVIIDGRIADIARSGFLAGQVIVPRFVLRELQTIADSEDTMKRNRGRRGLDVLNTLGREGTAEVRIEETDYPEITTVDSKLVRLAQDMGAMVMTNDYNLNKVAELQGVQVLNINELANALKPVVLPGEEMRISILREGKEAGQGVGYLDDGTMVVIEGGRDQVGDEVDVMVTSVLQTSAGRMIFAKIQANV